MRSLPGIHSKTLRSIEEGFELGALLQLALNVARIEQVQPLGGDRFVIAFVLHPGGAGWASEQREERAGDAAVGQGDGRLVLGDVGERFRDGAGIKVGGPGDLVDGVNQHFRIQPP